LKTILLQDGHPAPPVVARKVLYNILVGFAAIGNAMRFFTHAMRISFRKKRITQKFSFV